MVSVHGYCYEDGVGFLDVHGHLPQLDPVIFLVKCILLAKILWTLFRCKHGFCR